MIMPYELFIGLRYLKSKRRDGILSLISLLSSGGVALGVLALIVVLSVMSGFHTQIQEKILGMNAQIQVLRSGGITASEQVLQQIEAVPDVTAASPFTLHQVMLTSRQYVSGAVVKGIDPEREPQVTRLARNMKVGSITELRREKGRPGIILGKSLAAHLGAYRGSKLNVISPLDPALTPMGMTPRVRVFEVVGIFDSGMFEYDSGWAFVNLKSAQEFFRMSGAVTGIQVRLQDVYQAPAIAAVIRDRLGSPFYTKTWMQMYSQLFSALKVEKTVMFVILVMIVLVAAFGIVSMLSMVVMEKAKEIAILKSMGATAGSIMRIFMVEGLVIGSVGTLLGVVGGVLVTVNLDGIVRFVERTFGFTAFPRDVYFLETFPHQINPGDMGAVILLSLLISFLATLYPSWQAARLEPVVAMRYE